MKPTVILTAVAAAASVILPPTLDARDNHGGGGGGGGRSFSAPQTSAPSAPRVSAQSSRPAQVQNFRQAAPSQFSRPSVNVERGNSQAFTTQSRPVQTQRQQQAQFQQQQTQQFSRSRQVAPTIAFGGSVPQQRADRDNQQQIQQQNAQNRAQANRNWNNPQVNNITRAQAQRMRPSEDISRHWDHRKVYSWNRHRYHYYNNNWVILDGGGYYGYGGGYYDAPYDTGYYDDSADYAPPTEEDSPVYDAPAGLASDVQEQLTRQGYDTGGVDGVIGPQTRNAIAAFQNDHRMPVTGRIDQSLLRALRIQ